MDIKLKKSSKKLIAVFIAFLLCVSSFAAALTIGITTLYKAGQIGDPLQMLNSRTYEDSGSLQDDFLSRYNNLYWTKSNETEHNIDEIFTRLTKVGFSFYLTNGTSVFTNIQGFESEPVTTDVLRTLGSSQGAYRLFADGKMEGNPQISSGLMYGDRALIRNLQSSETTAFFSEPGGGELQTVFFAFTQNYVDTARDAYEGMREELVTAGVVALAFAFLTLVFFIILCVLCGRQDETGRPVLRGVDGWFTELLLAVLAGCIILCGYVTVLSVESMNHYEYYGYYGYDYFYVGSNVQIGALQIAVMAAGIWVTGAMCLTLLLSIIKKAKAGRFFRDFFIVKITMWIWTGLREIYYGSSVMKKVIIMIALMCLGSATVVFFPVILVVALVFIAKWVRQYEAIKEGVRIVKDGDPTYKIPIAGEPLGELQQLAADINAISGGFDVAVKQELKNQRMKTELISNVSHDIKTPLTSIITYVDLLKKEGLDCEDAPKYLDVLDQKSIRLKKLTEDLFEAAKASSGDIPVNMGKVELVSLLNQTLGELDDRLAARGLDVILKTDQEKYFVSADGQLMWRVLENLFGNAIKYALENSRVYVDIRQEHVMPEGVTVAVLEMKNVSKNALNIPADELMERFKRGDESRSTDGSGLGLSIARDLMNIQNGKFDIYIDGDLFKAVMILEICQ